MLRHIELVGDFADGAERRGGFAGAPAPARTPGSPRVRPVVSNLARVSLDGAVAAAGAAASPLLDERRC